MCVCSFKFFFSASVRSLQRALDRRLYLLLYGNAYGSPTGGPVWHFPEKVYESEETMRKVIDCHIGLFCYLPFTNLFQY